MDIETQKLDDVASLVPAKDLDFALQQVGMENIQSQVQVQGLLLPARSEALVSLVDRETRGIHMSRLYKIISNMHEQELSWPWLGECLQQMLVSQGTLSDSAFLQVAFELPVWRKSLISTEHGWRNYPLKFRVSNVQGKREMKLTARVLYSSTCPNSEGLSRLALKQEFQNAFPEPELRTEEVLNWLQSQAASVAVPHAQRSEAICEFTLDPDEGFPTSLSLIDEIENALGTPVQAAVKREDEQEFARRNAQNLMFCEDAARRLKAALLNRADVIDFKIEVRHFESLHPHDVVARVNKND